MISVPTGSAAVVDPKTDQGSACPAELLRAISQSQSRQAGSDVDGAALMRLADDPLLLNAFLQRASAAPLSSHACRKDVAAGLIYPLQVKAVSIRETEGPKPVRLYVGRDPSEGTSTHAFAFRPSLHEHDIAWDSKASSASGKPIITPVSCRLWPWWLLLGLAISIMAFTLILNFG